MRLKLFLLLAFVPALVCTAKPEGLSGITVMSYNIRSGEASDGTNSWQFRFPATAMMIEDQKPDILGIQEAMQYQLLFITENCRDYKYAGAGSEDGKSKGEHTAILYNKKTTSLLKWGTFWLSDTPDKPSVDKPADKPDQPSDVAQTGDNANPALWIAIGVAALLAVIAAAVSLYIRNRNRKHRR